MKIAIVAGGTGGHIYPGLAIADEIKSRDHSADIIFLGSSYGLEADIIKRSGYRFMAISARPLIRKIAWQALAAPFYAVLSIFQSLYFLKRFRPQSVILTGGYASLPAALAARLLGIPFYVHEQNVLPGVTNRICSRLAKRVFLSFERSLSYLPGTVTGNPVRQQIMRADRYQARRAFGFNDSDRVVLIMGGSQGSRRINQATIAALPLLQGDSLKLLHILGSRDYAMFKPERDFPFYRSFDYLYNIAEALAAADLVISRAGATAIAEFLVREVPMILVPFPFSAEGHQAINAEVVSQAGAGIVIGDADFSADKIAQILLGDDSIFKKMKDNCRKLARPSAAAEIARAIL